MKSKFAYTHLVKAFIERDFFDGEEKFGSSDLPLPTPKIVKRKKPGPYSLLNDKFAEECIDLDREKISDEAKYYKIVCISFKTYLDSFSKENKQPSDKEFIEGLKIFLDEKVEENDRMFALLYVMSEGVLSEEERSDIWNNVVNGKFSTFEACQQMKFAAYKVFSKTDDPEVKKGCTKMIVAFQKNLTDINEINKKCQFDENGNSPLYDSLYYIGRSFDTPDYVGYGKTVSNLDDAERKKHVSPFMNGMYHALAVEGNKLYTDKGESEKTKANCYQLLKKMDEYGVEYARVTKDMEELGYRTKAEIPKTHEDLLSRVNALEKKGKEINNDINQLSADTSSKRWGVIALFSTIILALGALTMGFGWGFGISKMVSSIRSDSQFFKINNEHQDVVKKAREIMKVTDPTKINLLLLEDLQEVEIVESSATVLPSSRGSSQD